MTKITQAQAVALYHAANNFYVAITDDISALDLDPFEAELLALESAIEKIDGGTYNPEMKAEE